MRTGYAYLICFQDKINKNIQYLLKYKYYSFPLNLVPLHSRMKCQSRLRQLDRAEQNDVEPNQGLHRPIIMCTQKREQSMTEVN